MSLVTGARLGPYEIVTLIGAGGMGEVYKARDTRLNRIVAIKIPTSGRAPCPVRPFPYKTTERTRLRRSAGNSPRKLFIY